MPPKVYTFLKPSPINVSAPVIARLPDLQYKIIILFLSSVTSKINLSINSSTGILTESARCP